MIATDPLSLLFIVCFLFGLAYLLINALLGGIGHHGHIASHHGGGHISAHIPAHAGGGNQLTHTDNTPHGQSHYHHNGPGFSILSVLNPTSIVLFLFGFGFFGYVFHNNTSFELPIVCSLAAVGGLIIAFLILTLLSRVFGNSETSTILDVSDRTGLLGKVNITIPERGLGEIIYISPGKMRKSIPARSVDGRRLERDQEVVVVNFQNGIAEVDTWDHFVNHEDESLQLSVEEDDLATLRALLDDIPEDNSTNNYIMRNDTQKE
jgi:hypothetical protein